MAGKIPQAFIDQVLVRVDIVDVIDRRVPLTRKGKEYQACCPFHEEKTPSFTVSPAKQFYHCFGCGTHGTAITFLMEYANLGFVEAVEELAEGAGLPMPDNAGPQAATAGQSPAPLLAIVAEANHWFQQQLRTHAGAKQAIAYLKGRGLDGRIAADFGIGYAPDGWDNLAHALGTDKTRQQQLLKAGLVAARDKSGGKSGGKTSGTSSGKSNDKSGGKPSGKSDAGLYDRFRSRVIFPIEDHRGRVVAFGGRILGEGEPKYLNSPETPLFHKGAELYGLHRARREIGQAGRSIVVEGYMDVVSLAQFGITNAVATLGTATTPTHVQRLFRLAPEIVFCFDGDRAGRAAAWKAMQASLPEMRDGRQLGFLFLPEGEDPDTVVRAEKKDGFAGRVEQASSLENFLFDSLISQVDMARMDGKARLVSFARPLIEQLPRGVLREMMFARLSALSGLSGAQLGKHDGAAPTPTSTRGRGRRPGPEKSLQQGQPSTLALATSLLLQNPSLAAGIPDPEALKKLDVRGAEVLLGLIQKITVDPEVTTARLLEAFRGDPTHKYLEKLAGRRNLISSGALTAQFNDALDRLLENHAEQRRLSLIEKLRLGPEGAEKQALEREMKALLDARKETLKARAGD